MTPLEAAAIGVGVPVAVIAWLSWLGLRQPARDWWQGRRQEREVAATAARAWWRLVSRTPPGRRHERNVRRHLGMPRGHPEHVTRPDGRADDAMLAALERELWPEGEWTWVIRMHLEGEL